MFSMKILCYVLFLYSIDGQIQLNLYLTDWEINNENKNDDLQHHCLYNLVPMISDRTVGQIVPYCMSIWPDQWKIEENHLDQKFTSADLAIQNITSHQLYLWFAPMDIIENYQQYLNELPNSEKTSMAKKEFIFWS